MKPFSPKAIWTCSLIRVDQTIGSNKSFAWKDSKNEFWHFWKPEINLDRYIIYYLSIHSLVKNWFFFVNSCMGYCIGYFRKVKQVYFCHFGIQIGNWFENNWGIEIPRSQVMVFESNVKWVISVSSLTVLLIGLATHSFYYR